MNIESHSLGMNKTFGTRRYVVTIGSFDGVHRGHASVLKETARRARRLGVRSLVISFVTPPRMVLKNVTRPELLSTPDERGLLARSLGISEVRFLRFSKTFSKNTPRQFFDDYLVHRFGAVGVVVGPDFRFGHNRGGDPWNLKEWGGKAIPVWPVKTARAHAHKLSSRHIRRLVKTGRLAEAGRELGHRYFAEGRVVHGKGLGRRMGFPTVNLATPKEKVLPKGVYAVRVFPNSYEPTWFSALRPRSERTAKGWPGVCNIGLRPTIQPGQGKLSFEVHLLTPVPSLYGKRLWVEFISWMRSEKKFSSLNALRAQIERDIQQARKLLFTKREK
jgi:riboflavin kinase/FMN adenylyltransferase